ncbi:MAG: aldo/keto reductase [Nostoc sp.]|uniref:aldo/keto reductase n=1 Tax=Nostoc sp. TaxID=1180 RepID=UPI002FF98160
MSKSGTEWDWGSDETTVHQIFNTYVDAGGNFIDTADSYTNGITTRKAVRSHYHRSLLNYGDRFTNINLLLSVKQYSCSVVY